MDPELKIACPLLERRTLDQVNNYLAGEEASLSTVINKFPLAPHVSDLMKSRHPTDYFYFAPGALSRFNRIEEMWGRTVLGKYNKIASLILIGNLSNIIEMQKLPKSFVDAWPNTLERLIDYLFDARHEDYVYPEDFFCKDVRILTGRALSYRARVIDIDVYLPRTIYRYNGWRKNLSCLLFLFTKAGGLGPYLRGHLDHRYIDHLSEQEYREYRSVIAEYLQLHDEYGGLVGTGWLEDPGLEIISPKFEYRFRIGVECGAYLRCDGPVDANTQRAILKSKTRRDAFERGEYKPLSYTAITPRDGILKWYARLSQTNRNEVA